MFRIMKTILISIAPMLSARMTSKSVKPLWEMCFCFFNFLLGKRAVVDGFDRVFDGLAVNYGLD